LYHGNYCIFGISFTPTSSGTRTGTLNIASNDPVNPVISVSLSGTGVNAYTVPSITQLDPPTVLIGTTPFTLNISGSNFFPQSVVRVNGQPQVTTYRTGSYLQATVDPSLRTDYGEVSVTVFNPAPGGGESSPAKATLYREVLVTSNFMVSVPTKGLLYASVPASASNNANTVVPIDPITGAMGTPIPVGNDPRMIVASDDGKYLYVALYGDQAIQRINLSSNTVDRTFPFPSIPNVVLPPINIADMHVVPGSPTSLVAAIQNYWGVVALYNDSGLVNYVPTNNQSVTVSGFAFLDASSVYALPFTNAQNAFFNIFTLDSAGIHFTPYSGTNYGGNSQTGSSVVSDGKLLYTSSGEVWDPDTQKMVGTFPSTAYNSANDLLLDEATQRIYMLDYQSYATSSAATAINAYDTGSFRLLNSLSFPAIVPYATGLNRWGTDGLAFLGQDSGSMNQTLYLLRSSMVTQAPAPAVSFSATSLQFANQDQGTTSATQTITLTNSGSATLNIKSIAVAGPFSSGGTCVTSLAAGASCTITVAFTPTFAGATTGTLTVSDNTATSPHTISLSGTGTAPAVANFSAMSLTFPNQDQGTTSASQAITVTNSGGDTLNITSIAVTGPFSSGGTCAASVAAGTSCTITVAFSPLVAGTTTGTLLISDNTSTSPHTISLSGTGTTPTLTLGVEQGGSTAATVTAGQTASYQLAVSGTPGFSGSVSLACTGVPANSACSVSPATVTLANGGTANFTVSVTTKTSVVAGPRKRGPVPVYAFAMLGVGAILFTVRSGKRKYVRAALLFLSFMTLPWTACGGGGFASVSGAGGGSGNQPGQPIMTAPGNYTVILTATSGTVSVTQKLTLVVQ